MSRYDIAKRQNRRIVLRFRTAQSPEAISICAQQCIEQESDFSISNQTSPYVEHGITQAARKLGYPIMVNEMRRARIMKIAYGYNEIYAVKEWPSDLNAAIIFDDVREYPNHVTPVLKLRKSGNGL